MFGCLLQNLFGYAVISILAASRHCRQKYCVHCGYCGKENPGLTRDEVAKRRSKFAPKMSFLNQMLRRLPWSIMQSKLLWHFISRKRSRARNFGVEKRVTFLCSMIAEEDASYLRSKASPDYISKFLSVVQEILNLEGTLHSLSLISSVNARCPRSS